MGKEFAGWIFNPPFYAFPRWSMGTRGNSVPADIVCCTVYHTSLSKNTKMSFRNAEGVSGIHCFAYKIQADGVDCGESTPHSFMYFSILRQLGTADGLPAFPVSEKPGRRRAFIHHSVFSIQYSVFSI